MSIVLGIDALREIARRSGLLYLDIKVKTHISGFEAVLRLKLSNGEEREFSATTEDALTAMTRFSGVWKEYPAKMLAQFVEVKAYREIFRSEIKRLEGQ